jgi:hypothetical protein
MVSSSLARDVMLLSFVRSRSARGPFATHWRTASFAIVSDGASPVASCQVLNQIGFPNPLQGSRRQSRLLRYKRRLRSRLVYGTADKAKRKPTVIALSEGSKAVMEHGSFSWHTDLPAPLGRDQ